MRRLVPMILAAVALAGCASVTAIREGSCNAAELERLQSLCLSHGGSFQGDTSATGLEECEAEVAIKSGSAGCVMRGSGNCKVVCTMPSSSKQLDPFEFWPGDRLEAAVHRFGPARNLIEEGAITYLFWSLDGAMVSLRASEGQILDVSCAGDCSFADIVAGTTTVDEARQRLESGGVFSHLCWSDGHNRELTAVYQETFEYAAEGHLMVSISAQTADEEKFVGGAEEVRRKMGERKVLSIDVAASDSYEWPDWCENDPKAEP